ncbi:mannose-1-phosphate guanyltransferase beta [Thecamonas trahens ATCC 50062]|uniref:mannose-1-phosphate guanylyltransferase n=1 Tax=Thecamonas trahens ATCC 50062 TaxID=461836 RepID=A0A0L0DIS9_THETB|nr:mannose-1-phosphate guanyltransferase beta [Thecamonas trahens ATCC 50062]KNC52207.1 mannose-1-phosphate guanyltransferase beta [Thecamonas trahens ATCC 50062]|eukprot:XP_013762210.1 mannose-1-phosphate guanyltransferase beta [Thecamonas trahens ATCC 50062]
MKALILVGGFGTRLRPLTLSAPKPVVPFANKEIVLHQIEALVKAGIDEVVLAVNYQPEKMMEAFPTSPTWVGGKLQLGIRISTSLEEEPLGTAGPLKLAESILGSDGEPFIVLNSDVICTFPFEELIAFHKAHGKEGTIMVTKVEEPSKYGVVVSDGDGKIERFVEKPQVYVGNRINAGIYIFNPAILERIPLAPTSIEKKIFPVMADEGQLYCMDLPAFWMDIGQPPDYLKGMVMYLSALASGDVSGEGPSGATFVGSLVEGDNFIGPVFMHPDAVVDETALVGPNVVIGPGCSIGAGARVQRTTLLAGAKVKAHAWVKSSIIGWNSTVGRWARLQNISVLGEDVKITDELYINGARILPHKTIKDDIPTPSIVM